ncbi:MAG: phosphoenolpyruvate carboxykinase (GTP), partial [Leptolyngbya sp.]|nr:phosphoenolpyruvate carboxykinase (GTP) [Candidatus Melainabacteria bacterium]
WIFERSDGYAGGVQTPLGWTPEYSDMDWSGLSEMTEEKFAELMNVDSDEWLNELELQMELFNKVGGNLPSELKFIRELLKLGLQRQAD